MNIQDWFPLGWAGLISLLSKGLWRVFSNTTIWRHRYFGAQPSLSSNSQIHIWLLEKSYLWLYRSLLAKWCLCFLTCCLSLLQLFFQGASIDMRDTDKIHVNKLLFCFLLLIYLSSRKSQPRTQKDREKIIFPPLHSDRFQQGLLPLHWVLILAPYVVFLLEEARWLKPPTLARHHSNHLHELFYGRRSW